MASMNNLAMGSAGGEGASRWDYYETIGGGMGASAISDGLSAVQTHMTNTLNTPIEVLESTYPVRVTRYQQRTGSGGKGKHQGGEGMVREFEFLQPATATLLTERRLVSPWGAAGGESGKPGINRLNGQQLPGKCQLDLKVGDTLTIETPGGGGYGEAIG